MLCCCKEQEPVSLVEVSAHQPNYGRSTEGLLPFGSKLVAKQKVEELEGITFEPGTDELTTAGKLVALNYVNVLRVYSDTAVKLIGYSCEDLPTRAHNKQLARNRCRAARKFLKSQACRNKIAIQGLGKMPLFGDEVNVEVCDSDQVDSLEQEANEEDDAFAKEQEDAAEENKVVEEPPSAPVAVEDPAPPNEQAPKESAPEEPAPEEPKVELQLSDDKGDIINLQLVKRPLGLTLDLLQSRLKVKSVLPDSQARASGVEVGMTINTINGESLSNTSVDDAWAKLKEAASKLPST